MTSVGFKPEERFETGILNEISGGVSQVRALMANPSNTREQRTRYERSIAALRQFGAGFPGTYVVPPTETFTDQLLIDDSERPVRLMFLGRANTDGDAIAWLPKQRIVMTGDIVVSPIPFGFYSYPESWISVLERLKALNFATLIPGHGEPMTDESYLDRLIATIRDIRARVGPLARQGLSVEEVRSQVDFSEQSAIFGTTPRLKAGFESLWLTPMVENAYKEARGLPIIQGGGEGDSTPQSVNRRK
jgi:glyoxylase-like metal-dependent hydrolase (beta-lactamase superfamily II)